MVRVLPVLSFMLMLLVWSGSSSRADGRVVLLYDTLKIDEILDLMRTEGIADGEALRTELFPGSGPDGGGWAESVRGIYDIAWMKLEFRRHFVAGMQEHSPEPLLDFFTSDLGRKIVSVEVLVRRAFLDENMEELARQAFEDARAEGNPRLDPIEEFIETNDLIGMNVEGALNAGYAFLSAFRSEMMSEGRILSDLQTREPEIRADTGDWLHSYLFMAFAPLTGEEVADYIAISDSAEGKAMNRALFSAFDKVFIEIAARLGEAAASYMAGKDI